MKRLFEVSGGGLSKLDLSLLPIEVSPAAHNYEPGYTALDAVSDVAYDNDIILTSPHPSPKLGEGAVLHELTSDRNAGEVRYSAFAFAHNDKAAFTLAEVLITLGIVGVVAALTLPTLIANIKDKSIESAFKKAQSSLINGYKSMMGKESITEVKNLEMLKCTNSSCLSTWHKSTFNVVQDSEGGLKADMMPQEYVKEDGSGSSPFSWSNVPYLFRTADGMNYGVEIDDGSQSFSVYADINGNKTPNTACKDMVKFRISGTGQISNVCGELAEDPNACSLDNPSVCSYEECLKLDLNDTVTGPEGYPVSGGWSKKGHFVSVDCYPTLIWYDDRCTTNPEFSSYYCR